MNHSNVDTRATAFVFGELSPKEAAAFERELEKSPQLREEVMSIREAISALESELDAHNPPVSTTHKRQIEQAIAMTSAAESDCSPAAVNPSDHVPDSVPPTPLSLRRQSVLALLAIAASALILFGLVNPPQNDRAAPVSMKKQRSSPESADAGISPGVAEKVTSDADHSLETDPTQRDAVLERVSSYPQANDEHADARAGQQVSAAEKLNDVRVGDTSQKQTAESLKQTAEVSGDHIASAERAYSLDVSNSAVPEDSQQAAAAEQGGSFSVAETRVDTSQQYDAESSRSLDVAATPVTGVTELSRVEDLTPTPGPPDTSLLGLVPGDVDGSDVLGQGAGQVNAGADTNEDVPPASGEVEIALAGELDGFAVAPRRRGRWVQSQRDYLEPQRKDIGDGADADSADLEGADLEGADLEGADLEGADGDRFDPIVDNPFMNVRDQALSTFSVDVDTASYAKVRALLSRSILPRPDAVRIEEWLNYFDYDYPESTDDHPFAASMEIAACPWNQTHRLARIGIRGKSITTERPASNLVFLLDVSGSMNEPNKLPLVVEGMKMLTDQLTENDSVAIVVYAGAAGLILDATRGDQKSQIVEALDKLRAGGSTNGGQGILLAYEIARDNFIVGGTNRVVLCTDGDFNLGLTSTDRLEKLAEQQAKSSKVFLSVLGFGIGNHDDAMMERISNIGNGNYSYIDSRQEARKVLVEELGGTLVTIAKDVKIQIEFNPKEVASYRLIGYENRVLATQDFDDDRKDAGEIGAGHTVTALYELVPVEGDHTPPPPPDSLRYQQPSRLSEQAASGETLVLKLRYKQPDDDVSKLIEIPVSDQGKHLSQTDRDFKFAASVAAFGMILRDSPYKGKISLAGVERLAREGAKGDDFGYRSEFVDLVVKARELREE